MMILQCLSRMAKLGYPSCEKTMLSVVECPLCDTQAGKESIRYTVSHLLWHDSATNDLM
jgi:hypothetical protein